MRKINLPKELTLELAEETGLHTVAVRGKNMLNQFFKIIKPANPKHIKKFNTCNKNS